jgi:eukaryotic-like serine/threonine-protein kinase
MANPSAATTWTCATCGRPYPAEFAVCPLDATPQGDSAARGGDALIGQVLGRTYRVARVLGQGGMARLYEATHVRIGARYAVKVIHDDLARDPDQLVRFEREARAAGRIHSDHVVRLVDVLRTPDDRPCIVTELLEGEDLQALLDRSGKLSVEEAVPIARQICRAMAAAHAVGVIHRDLKPSNVFLCKGDGAPGVKVFDFGVAKLADDEKLTRTDAVMGTAAYMAPEQARRAADAGPLADVYSVGAVLYHMLTGEPPYGNVPAVSRFALVLHEEPARPRSIAAEIPDGIEAVIQHAMARDPAARIASPLLLEAQLAVFDRRAAALVATQPAPATEPAADNSAANLALRNRTARPLAVFVAAASSVGAGAWLAALLGALFEPESGGERGMISVMALAAIAAVAVLQARRLERAWRSATAVSRHIAPYTRALVAGTLTSGALALLGLGWSAAFGGAPVGGAGHAILVGAAAALGLGWRRWKLDERVRRRIG